MNVGSATFPLHAGDTKTFARVAVEALPRSGIVVQQLPDPSDMAVLEGHTASLADKLNFTNEENARL